MKQLQCLDRKESLSLIAREQTDAIGQFYKRPNLRLIPVG
jgi:hypothetical protein